MSSAANTGVRREEACIFMIAIAAIKKHKRVFLVRNGIDKSELTRNKALDTVTLI